MAQTVHIVFGMSAAGSIRQALQHIGCNERVVGFIDDLSFGPIDSPTARVREPWIADKLGYDFEEVCRRADRFWTEVTSSGVSPVAWVCRNHALEYAGFLEFVWRMADKPFRVVDATDVKIPGWRTPLLWSLGLLTPPQIVEARLFESQRQVSTEEMAQHRDLWRRLRAENAPFRVVDATGLVSAPITHFDVAILECVPSDWQKGARVVGDAMVKLHDEPLPQSPSDMIIWSRVLALGKAGTIEISGDGPDMRGYRVRRKP